MNFAFSDEQEELRTSVRRFLAEKSPETEVRRLMDTTEGYDPAVWSQMADQLGLQSLTIPEEFGGSGFTYVELLVVLEEMGAALLCAPFFSSVALGANALLTSGDDEAKKAYLPGIASGETIATLAITEDNGKWDFSGIELAATKKGDGWELNGHKMFVIDGHVANLIIVAARTAAGVSLFAVDGDAAGLTRTPLPTMDQTRKQARLEFASTPAVLIGTDGGAEPGLSKTLDLAAVALAAEQVGGAQRVLDASVEYAKTRIQFGRPIGSFQAVAQRLADAYIDVEAIRLTMWQAAWQLAGAPDAPDTTAADGAAADGGPAGAAAAGAAVATAKFWAADAGHRVAHNAVHVHGGMGIATSYPLHRYFTAAKHNEFALGGATAQLRRLGAALALGC